MINSEVDPYLFIDGDSLTIEDVVAVARNRRPVMIAPQARERVLACRQWVDRATKNEGPLIYGLNTGLGSLACHRIPAADAAKLTLNLLRSHASGIGKPFDEEVVRAAMLIRANSLAKGHSGLRLETLESLTEMLNRGIHPVIPEKGSVGASGDLAPLSHLALVLIGEGEAFYQGQQLPGGEALQAAGLVPVTLGAREGLALNNGTAIMAALVALALHDAENLVRHAEIALAMSLEALLGLSQAFDARLHAVRRHQGQQNSAANVRRLTAGSELLDVDSEQRVQDAYSLRCAPAVLGAVRDSLAFIRQTVTDEINAVTDNPLVFLDLPGENKALSGGNFHGEPLALAADFLTIAVAEVGNIAERRIFRLLDHHLNNGLPAMLVEGGGLRSGLMITQYTAAALVSENKTLAHPDSVDSIPTCEGQEDHVSMGANAARHAREAVWNTERIVAIELLCAAQALDLRLRQIDRQAGQGTAAAHRYLREHGLEPITEDRPLTSDIEKIAQMIHEGTLLGAVEKAIGERLL